MAVLNSDHPTPDRNADDWADIEADEERATYGRWASASTAPGRAKFWAIFAALAIAAGVGWSAWSGFKTGSNSITSTDRTFSVIDDSRVTITFDIARPKGTEVTCRVRASDDNLATVGTTQVTIPASQTNTVDRITAQVRTATRAVTVTVTECDKVGEH